MSQVAKSPIGGKRPFILRKGIASLADLKDGLTLAATLSMWIATTRVTCPLSLVAWH